MSVQVIVEPSFEPVSLNEARRWLGLEVDETDHTVTLRILIKAMREFAENLTLRAFVSRTLKLTLPCFPLDPVYGHRISLPFAPAQSLTSFQYRDTDETLQTMDPTLYQFYNFSEPGFIVPARNVAWPTLALRPDSVQVTYVAGYAPGSPPDEASSQETIPAALRLWMEARIATLFNNREQIIVGTIVQALPRDQADALLDSLTLGDRIF